MRACLAVTKKESGTVLGPLPLLLGSMVGIPGMYAYMLSVVGLRYRPPHLSCLCLVCGVPPCVVEALVAWRQRVVDNGGGGYRNGGVLGHLCPIKGLAGRRVGDGVLKLGLRELLGLAEGIVGAVKENLVARGSLSNLYDPSLAVLVLVADGLRLCENFGGRCRCRGSRGEGEERCGVAEGVCLGNLRGGAR